KVERLEFGEGARRLISGELDAAFWQGVYPNANISWATARGARLVEVGGPEIERFRAKYPFLKSIALPGHTYSGIEAPIHTIGVDGILVCREELDESQVHELTRAFFDAIERADGGRLPFDGLNFIRAASTVIPLHPGAARYYREQELVR